MTNQPIFIALSPNTEPDDIALAKRLIIRPWQWQKGPAIDQLEFAFKQQFNCRFAFSFAAARTALGAILQALDIGQQGDEVLLQAYTCSVVPEAIIRVGGRPIWVDIDPQTFNMDPSDLVKKITSRTKAVIVQHTFGQPAPLAVIQKITRKHRLILIEDCAQALGVQYQGRQVGVFGEAAFFSFGRDKIISSIFGGLAITNNQKIGRRLAAIQADFPWPPKRWIMQQLFHPLAFNLITRYYHQFGKGLHFIFNQLGLLSRATKTPKALDSRLANALAAMACQQFEKLERFNQRRQQIARLYDQGLSGLAIERPQIKPDNVFLRYTIKTDRAEELMEFAKKRGVYLGDWYRSVIAPRGVDFNKIFYQPGTCSRAEKASALSINLPTHPNITVQAAKKVVKILKEFYDD